MLRTIRILLAILCFAGVTLLFLDVSGVLPAWLGWLAKIQFLPAVLALHFGIVAALVLLTLLFGRIYCSVICPLGVMQDLFGWLGAKSQGKKGKYRFAYSPAKQWLRYGVLALFVGLLLVGATAAAALIAPYSAYGRIAQNLLAPLYGWGNNLLAWIAERADSYAFHTTEVWMRSLPVFLIAVATLLIVGGLAWRNGRTWCNTVCPVGTVLGFFARFSWLRPVIDTSKCNHCKLCSRRCKAACIDPDNHTIDYSRCVACMDCIETCAHGAISYRPRRRSTKHVAPEPVDTARRSFLTGAALLAGTAVAHAQQKKVDGGLAVLLDRKVPARKTPVVPPGAVSLRHLTQHCTGCQLCVSACPNGVLRPSADLRRLMQPESSYERGYCRPECVACAEVCPTRAILRITPAEKSAIQVGRAVWVRENCVVLTDGVTCGNCARHCPVQAIHMVPSIPGNPDSPQIPAVDESRCIGCGACENLCPARPFSAIYVEGYEVHHEQ